MAPGAVACVISLICHVPVTLAGLNGLKYHKVMRDLGDIYDVIPHGQNFRRGIGILGYGVRPGLLNIIRY
jgi:hypothetical protein